MNSQKENTDSKGDFVLKTGFKRSVLRFLEYENKSEYIIKGFVDFGIQHISPTYYGKT